MVLWVLCVVLCCVVLRGVGVLVLRDARVYFFSWGIETCKLLLCGTFSRLQSNKLFTICSEGRLVFHVARSHVRVWFFLCSLEAKSDRMTSKNPGYTCFYILVIQCVC